MTGAFRARTMTFAGIALLLASACATKSPPPLTYAAVERPRGPITSNGQAIAAEHPRGGAYFLNWGFRPAADVGAYLESAQKQAGSDVLKNADVKLNVPFALDILLFGFQFGSDTVTVAQ